MRKNRYVIVVILSATIMTVGLLLAFFMTKGLHIDCPLYKLTGILCPGCGNSRATLALLRFDFKAMLQHNLLYPLEMLYIARIYYVCCRNYIKGGRFHYHIRPDWIDTICLVAIVLWTIIRNLLTAPT